MALEPIINIESKTGEGIIGISKNPSALQRWFLTSHERMCSKLLPPRRCVEWTMAVEREVIRGREDLENYKMRWMFRMW